MATRPSVFPDWAVNPDGTGHDVADGTTGQNNVVVPPPEKTLIGWQYNEKPPRQYFNWLARLTTQWLRWFDDQVGSIVEMTGTCPSNNSFIQLPADFTVDNTTILSCKVEGERDSNHISWFVVPYCFHTDGINPDRAISLILYWDVFGNKHEVEISGTNVSITGKSYVIVIKKSS